MKKKLFLGLLAAAAVTFTACQKDEVINEVPQDQPIEFGTYVGRDAQTKASDMDLNALKDAGFGVFAYYTGDDEYESETTPNFMYNQKVNWVTSAWEYSPVKYWPNNTTDKITFMAYSPYLNNSASTSNVTSVSTNTVSGNPYIQFSVVNDPSNHKDLVYAKVENKSKTNTSADDISFSFNHALSRIGFKCIGMYDEINGDSNGEEDNHVHTSTDANTTITVQEIVLKGKFNTSGQLDLYTGNWTKIGSDVNTEVTYTISNDPNGDGNTDDTELNNVSTSSNNLSAQLNKNSEFIMIVPSYSEETEHNIKDITIQVVYTITTNDGAIDGGSVSVTNDVTSTQFDFNFAPGKAYNFNLHFGLKSVKFSATQTINGWNTTNGEIAVNVPIYTQP